jgi:hypothetical protein
VIVVVALRVNLRLEPTRELWKTSELSAVPRIGEKVEPLEGWGMAVVEDVQWDLHLAEVAITARYPSSHEEIEELIAGGWSATAP